MKKQLSRYWVPLILVFILSIMISTCSREAGAPDFHKIIMDQFQRYPEMQVQDLYKLVYQAAMGNIHLGVDPSVLKNYLLDEMERVEASGSEPLMELISPEGMIRLNLRPFKAKGGDPDELLQAMQQTSKTFKSDKEKITQYWNTIIEMSREGTIQFDKTEVDSFFKEMQSADFPAVHHSDKYLKLYHPAYRIILKQYMPELKQ